MSARFALQVRGFPSLTYFDAEPDRFGTSRTEVASMRFGVPFASLLVALSCLSALGAERQTPYKAYVVSDGVYVRSGPGKNYYPTMKLPLGAEVEVYRHDPGGWYAIRPPEESFTWVAARYVEVGDDGLGTITGEQVAARVGSTFSDIRDVIQVRLYEGEVVEILGEKQFTGSSEAGKWYRIAPPSGEFRWVFGRLVDPDYMTSGVRETSGNSSPLLIPPRPPARPAKDAEEKLEEPAHLSDLDATPETPHESDYAVIEPSVLDLSEEKIGRSEAGSEEERQQASWVAADGATDTPAPKALRPERLAAYEEPAENTAAASAASRKSKGYISPRIPELNEQEEEDAPAKTVDRPLRPFGETLERLEFQLAQMLAEEPTVWSFTELEIQAQSLLERAKTALERGKVRLLLKKIAQSDDVKQRYLKFVDSETQLDRREQRLNDLRDEPKWNDAEARPNSQTASTSGRFDGHGRLGRIITTEPDAPRYALVENGKVTCYVAPAPGVNLDYYVGSHIGVVGTSGFMPNRQARLVTAKHVTPLNTASR